MKKFRNRIFNEFFVIPTKRFFIPFFYIEFRATLLVLVIVVHIFIIIGNSRFVSFAFPRILHSGSALGMVLAIMHFGW